MPTQIETIVALSPPRFLSVESLVTASSLAVGLLVSYLSAPNQIHFRIALVTCVVATASMIGVLATRIVSVRRGGGMQPITFTAEELVLPKSAFSAKVVRTPIERVRSACVVGRGFYARLVIDAGRRFFIFPLARLPDPAAVPRLQQALIDHLRARPNGAALVAAVERRHRLAILLGTIRPVGTWVAIAVIVGVFALEFFLLSPKNPFGLVDLGANAGMLVGRGQWFRLVTANLLHLNARHVFGNALSLLVIGGMVERLVGLRHSLIILLGTCIVSQIVSAAAGALPNGHLFSVGISGGIFGLLGALGAITWRFGNALPAGLRLPGWRWALIAGLYAVALPVLVPQVDSWAHGGGALAGFLGGGAMCLGCPDAESLRRPVWLTGEAFAALLLIFGAGTGADLGHALTQGAHAGDELVLAQTIFRRHTENPAVRNALAWQIATEPDAPPVLLRYGDALAVQAVRQLRRKPWNDPLLTAATDTEAVLEYRLGDPVRAMGLEAGLPWLRGEISSHLALFLDAVVRERGLQVWGDGVAPAPGLVLDHGVLRLTQSAPVPGGARVFALLRGREGVAGVLYFRIPAGFSGSQVLPLPVTEAAPSTGGPPTLWTDATTRLQVALFDRRGCDCNEPIGPDFAPYTPDPDIAP